MEVQWTNAIIHSSLLSPVLPVSLHHHAELALFNPLDGEQAQQGTRMLS